MKQIPCNHPTNDPSGVCASCKIERLCDTDLPKKKKVVTKLTRCPGRPRVTVVIEFRDYPKLYKKLKEEAIGTNLTPSQQFIYMLRNMLAEIEGK